MDLIATRSTTLGFDQMLVFTRWTVLEPLDFRKATARYELPEWSCSPSPWSPF